ncbi:alkaline phosphatase family protein [Streptomyces scopuliridis]|uniref:alkaline phosphatase family protein n=1 Tax=Streptomyces scopuliridis TaxID=452529 RepID=UPI0036C3B823
MTTRDGDTGPAPVPSDAMQRKESTISATPLTLIAVIDGLRPAALSASSAPFLSRSAGDGCSYGRAVATFPTLTRANAATPATGCLPGRTGIFGNRPALTHRTHCAAPADIAATAYTLVTGTLLDDADGRVLTESLRDLNGGPALPAAEQTIQRGNASVTLSRLASRSCLLGGAPGRQTSIRRQDPADQAHTITVAPGRPANSVNEE